MLSAELVDQTSFIKGSGVRIFVGKTIIGHQIVIYQIKFNFLVKTKKPMALILPVPNPKFEAGDINFLNVPLDFFDSKIFYDGSVSLAHDLLGVPCIQKENKTSKKADEFLSA